MPVEFKDYYKTLGVPREATDADIKRAFRKLARQYHPDIAKDKKTAEEKFKEINEAYEVLSDENKRRKYDELGSRWQEYESAGTGAPGGGYPRAWRTPEGAQEFHFGGTTGFSDFFEQFFGSRAGGGGGFEDLFGQAGPSTRQRWRPGMARGGADNEADLLVTLEETIRGAERTIQLQRIDPQTEESTTETIKVRIPAGVRDGQRLRIAGRGEPGHGGASAGDLYLRVRLAAHPDFRVHGDDLYSDLVLAPWEAVLGATIEVSAPGGQHVRVRVPPRTRSGTQLRLRGHGLPRADGGHGDLYVVVDIDVPENITPDEQALWEKLAHDSRFSPRRSSV
jgi:curved DNA-binding protein